jgi:nucleoside 2-deoxyribosyltransferase
MSTITCPFCGSTSCNVISSENNQYDCPSCGKYQLDCKAEEVADLPDINADKLCDFAGYLFEINRLSETFKSIKLIKENPQQYSFEDEVYNSGLVPKTAVEKMDKLLINLYKYGNEIVKRFDYISKQGIANYRYMKTTNDMSDIDHIHFPVCYAQSYSELAQIVMLCHEAGYFDFDYGDKANTNYVILEMRNGTHTFRFTIDGMNRAETLISSNQATNQIFIAMQFERYDEVNKTKIRRVDVIEALKEAAKNANSKLVAITVDEHEFNDGIMDRIKVEILRSKAVIADYTYGNQGVYFEAGYACGLGIPVIRCCAEQWKNEKESKGEQPLHFDERHNNTIFWKDLANLRERVENRIKVILR